MASRYQKFVVVRDPNRVVFGCIFCGQGWSPNIQTGGRLPRNAYKCPNGCADDYEEAYERWTKIHRTRNPITGKYEPVLTVKEGDK